MFCRGWINEALIPENLEYDYRQAANISGKQLERIMVMIAMLSYKVPEYGVGRGVTPDEAKSYYENNKKALASKGIPILTRADKRSLAAFVAMEVEDFKKARNKSYRKSLRIDKNKFLEILQRAESGISLQEEIYAIYVDLLLCKDDFDFVAEIKSSGDVDGKKSKSTLGDDILYPYLTICSSQKIPIYGIMQNTKGFKKNGELKGQLCSFLSKDLILVEEELWSLIAPFDVTFEQFKQLIVTKIDELKNNVSKTARRKKGFVEI